MIAISAIRRRTAAFAATALVLLAGCSSGADDGRGTVPSGSGDRRDYPATGFTTIALDGTDLVDVRVGPGFSVRAEGAPADLDRLKIVTDGATLRIGRKSGWSGSADGHSVKLSITMPRIVAAAAAGSGDMTIDHVSGTSFNAAGTGTGTIAIAALSVATASFSIAGSGDIRAAGVAQALTVSIAGTGAFRAPALKATTAKVTVAGTGDVVAQVTGTATVAVLGTGSVDLGNAARCAVSKLGTGTVRCGG